MMTRLIYTRLRWMCKREVAADGDKKFDSAKAGRGRVRLPVCANAEGEVRVFEIGQALSATLVGYDEVQRLE